MQQGAHWLIALVPPPDTSARIDELRTEFAANYNCVAALKQPVHLTLYEPFRLPDADMEAQLDKLRRSVATHDSFRLELKNFNFFENAKSPVIYIDVVPNADLKTLKTGIVRVTDELFGFESLSRKTFHPHFTIGYRDISPEVFPQVKEAYRRRTYSAVFKVDHVVVFRHNQRKWMPMYELPLGDENIEQASLF